MLKNRKMPEFAVRGFQRILVPLLIVFTITGVRAEKDDPIERYMLDHMFDSSEGNQGPGLAESIGEIKGSIVSLGSAIAEARQQFWSAYASGGPAFQDASK